MFIVFLGLVVVFLRGKKSLAVISHLPKSSFVIIIYIIQAHTDHTVNNVQLPLITKKKKISLAIMYFISTAVKYKKSTC